MSSDSGNQCRVCGGSTSVWLDFGKQPRVEPMWDRPTAPPELTMEPLTFDVCGTCGLIQICNPTPPEELYPEAQLEATSWKNLPQTDWQMRLLERYLSRDAVIVEVGSNDGYFLDALRKRGFSRLVGIDPSRPYGVLSRKQGFDIRESFATTAIAEQIVADYGRVDLVVAKHVFGHIPDLDGYFAFMTALLKPDGLFFLEIPDFSVSLDSADCSLMYEALVSYFTEETLCWTLGRFGFDVLEEKRFSYNGGLLEVLGRKSGSASKAMPPRIPENVWEFPKRVWEYARKLESRLVALKHRGWNIVMYGGGMRSARLLNSFGLGNVVDVVMDDNPAKQGKYYPGCGIPVVGSANMRINDEGKNIFLMAVSNENEDKALERLRGKFGDGYGTAISILGPKDRDAELNRLPQ